MTTSLQNTLCNQFGNHEERKLDFLRSWECAEEDLIAITEVLGDKVNGEYIPNTPNTRPMVSGVIAGSRFKRLSRRTFTPSGASNSSPLPEPRTGSHRGLGGCVA